MASRKGDPCPCLKFRDGLPLSQQKFVAKVIEVLEETEICRSQFHNGATTTAADRGMEYFVIKTMFEYRNVWQGYQKC